MGITRIETPFRVFLFTGEGESNSRLLQEISQGAYLGACHRRDELDRLSAFKEFDSNPFAMKRKSTVVVVMPAYRAEATLRKTYDEVLATGVVDKVIVVDDASCDQTVAVARSFPGVRVEVHERNRGYGANQKTCYRLALEEGADIVVMVHPDYQYTPRLIPAMVAMIESGHYACVLGSRILGGGATTGGMPYWKYVANRCLTLVQNLLFGSKLSEFHTGYRAYSRRLLEHLPLSENSDDFVFDCEILAQILWLREPIGELCCPARYESESSSIGFRRSVVYGFGCLKVGLQFRLARLGLTRFQLLPVQ